MVSSASQSGRAPSAPPPRRSPPEKEASLPFSPPEKWTSLHSPPHPTASLPGPITSPLESPKKKKEKEVEKKDSKKPLLEMLKAIVQAKSKSIVPMKKSTDIAPVWTQANTKFKYGKPLMTVDELARAGKACVDLHNYYVQACRDSNAQSIVVQYKR